MPYTRKLDLSELRHYAMCDRRLTPDCLATIEAKAAAGSKLEMECSTMTDSRSDYTRVLLDGVEIARAEGY